MSWRDRYQVHPAADLFPMMSDDELDELAADIEANGLTSDVVFWSPREEYDDDNVHRGPGVLLDGRNRLAALDRIGKDLPHWNRRDLTPIVDPVAFVMSANIRRRHLTREQKRDVITALLKLAPERSDRQVAKDVGVDHKTVGVVRRQSEGRGEIPHAKVRVDSAGRHQPSAKAVKVVGGRPTEAAHLAAMEGKPAARGENAAAPKRTPPIGLRMTAIADGVTDDAEKITRIADNFGDYADQNVRGLLAAARRLERRASELAKLAWEADER